MNEFNLEHPLPEIRVKEYNPNKHVRISQELFDITKSVSSMRNVHSVKLLYALAQAVQGKGLSHFPEITFSIDAAFDYLGVRNSNRRLEFLKEAFDTILDNALKLVRVDHRGNTHYSGLSWITRYDFSTDNSEVKVRLNPDTETYLLDLARYASIQPRHYMGLTTAYQAWFYPFLKNVSLIRGGEYKVSIDYLRTLLVADNQSYQADSRNGTQFFLNRVLGITLSPEAKAENMLSKKEKRPTRFVPWDYVTHNGEPTGTLYNINKHTELTVSASAVKSGRSYTHIIFRFGDWKTFPEEPTIEQDLFASHFQETIETLPPQEKEVAFLECDLEIIERYCAKNGITLEDFVRIGHQSVRVQNGKYLIREGLSL